MQNSICNIYTIYDMQYAKAICSKSRAIQKLKTKMYLVLHTLHRQILFSIWTNTILDLDKYYFQFDKDFE